MRLNLIGSGLESNNNPGLVHMNIGERKRF